MATDYEIIAAQLLRINPRNHEAWNDWGMGICGEALSLPKDEAAPMFAEAVLKLAVACDLSPQNPVYEGNFADALYQQAARSSDAVALPLFHEAGEVYERIIRRMPRSSSAWGVAAICLLGQANRVEVDRCEPLYHAAYVRLAVAAEIEPQDGWLGTTGDCHF